MVTPEGGTSSQRHRFDAVALQQLLILSWRNAEAFHLRNTSRKSPADARRQRNGRLCVVEMLWEMALADLLAGPRRDRVALRQQAAQGTGVNQAAAATNRTAQDP
jgi:hypothetical protein